MLYIIHVQQSPINNYGDQTHAAVIVVQCHACLENGKKYLKEIYFIKGSYLLAHLLTSHILLTCVEEIHWHIIRHTVDDETIYIHIAADIPITDTAISKAGKNVRMTSKLETKSSEVRFVDI